MDAISKGADGDLTQATEGQFSETNRLTEWTATLTEQIKKREGIEIAQLKQHKSLLDEATKIAMQLKRNNIQPAKQG